MRKNDRTVRGWILFFMTVLFLSGLTAIPLESELHFLTGLFPLNSRVGAWLETVYGGIHEMNQRYPFLAYGYDWLAFAHFTMAILFIGPLRDPVKNVWVIEFGMISCLLIIPFALIAGHFRDIPFWWRLVDCSFGVIGLIPLGICLKRIRRTEATIQKEAEPGRF